jgi:acetylglutamate kinase
VRLLVKIGGAQLEAPAARAEFAAALAQACRAGHEVVVVHGGGNQIREWVRKLGLPEAYHQGLRVTDEATAGVVLAVLCGEVNKWLVQALTEAGVRAVGLSGADGAVFHARKVHAQGAELGFVGAVKSVNCELVDALCGAGFVPVLATVAPLGADEPDSRERFYNINADMAAGPLGAALRADAILFLTDVPGVLDGSKRRLEELSAEQCAGLQAEGVIAGGMIPKVEAALGALAAHPGALVKIAPAKGSSAVLAALQPDTGTRFVASALVS